MASTASTAATLLPRPVGGASYLSSSSSASSHRRCLLGVRYARRLLAPHWTDGCPSDARPLASAACTICQSTIVDMQQEPKAKRSLLDNSTNLISGGSLRNMPDVEGSVIDLFGKPLFFSLYDWFLEGKDDAPEDEDAGSAAGDGHGVGDSVDGVAVTSIRVPDSAGVCRLGPADVVVQKSVSGN